MAKLCNGWLNTDQVGACVREIYSFLASFRAAPHRAVKIDDAQEVFRALKAEEGSAFGAWLFMVLTAARPSEVLEARWAEVEQRRCGVSRPVGLTALLRQLRHRARQGWDRRLSAHGSRSCFHDWCGDIGDVPRDLAEAALAHSLTATEGAYRRMTAVERRREVMTRYADWLNDERGEG